MTTEFAEGYTEHAEDGFSLHNGTDYGREPIALLHAPVSSALYSIRPWVGSVVVLDPPDVGHRVFDQPAKHLHVDVIPFIDSLSGFAALHDLHLTQAAVVHSDPHTSSLRLSHVMDT